MKALLLFFVIAFSGFYGVCLLEGLFQGFVDQRARALLGGSLRVASLRPITDDDRQFFANALQPQSSTEEVTWRTMIRSTDPQHPALAKVVEVKAVGGADDYPLVGEIRGTKGVLSFGDQPPPSQNDSLPLVYIAESLAQSMSLTLGDTVSLAGQTFVVKDLITEDSTEGFSAMTFGDQVYIHRSDLVRFQSLAQEMQISYRLLFLLEAGQTVDTDALKASPGGSAFYFVKAEDGMASMRRSADLALNIIGTMILIFVFFILVTLFSKLRILWASDESSYAMLHVLGTSWSALRRGHSKLYGAIMAMALVLSTLILELGLSVVPALIRFFFPIFQLPVPPLSSRLVSLLSLAGSMALMMGLLTYFYFRNLKHQSLVAALSRPSHVDRQEWLTTFFVFAVLAWATSQTAAMVTVFLIITFAMLIGFVELSLMLARFNRLRLRQWTAYNRLAWLSLIRPQLSMKMILVSLFILSFTIQSVFHLQASLQTWLSVQRDQPDYFLFNIPEDSIEALKSDLQKRGTSLEAISPLIQGRIVLKNGKPVDEVAFKNYPVRLSYRDKPFISEQIVQGFYALQPFDASSTVDPSLSVEMRYAERHGLRLGDRLTFDILGQTVTAIITSIREVDWLRFEPNFFLSFQTGVLEDAPKSFVATVRRPAGQNTEFYSWLVSEWSSVSVVSVEESIAKVQSLITLLKRVALAVLVLIVIFGVWIVAVLMQELFRKRRLEWEVFAMQAPSSTTLRSIVQREFLFLVVFVTTTSTLFSFLFSKTLVEVTFSRPFTFYAPAPLLGVLTLSLVIGLGLIVLSSKIRKLTGRNLIE